MTVQITAHPAMNLSGHSFGRLDLVSGTITMPTSLILLLVQTISR